MKLHLFFSLLFAIPLASQQTILAQNCSADVLQTLHENNSEKKGVYLKGIILENSNCKEKSLPKKVEGIYSAGLDAPGGDDALANYLEPRFLYRELNPELLVCLKEEIIRYYRRQNHPFVVVEIPEQEISDGIIKVTILEGTVEQIVPMGNRWVSDSQLINAVGLKPKNTINSDNLLNNISWFNRNPFHKTDLLLTPGMEKGTTIIELTTKDRFPLRPYIGGDNTGVSEVVGRARYFGGFNASNLLLLNDVLSFQYTASSDFSELQSYTLHHTIPLPWKHIFIIYGGYSSNNPDSSQFRGKGHSSQASGRYLIPIKPFYDSAMREFTIGYDWKYTNNNLQYVDFFPFIAVGSNINLGQVMAGFNYGNTFSFHKVSFSIEAFGSFGHYLPHQNDHDYQKLRYKAKSSYVYSRISIGDWISLPKSFSLSALLRMQLASANLLPSEEFGLGGYDTVRGYNERELNADNALCTNLELYTPPLEFNKLGNHQLKFLAFFDYGLGNHVNRLPGEPFTRYLMGVGGGVRYSISEYFSSRLDWGFKLHKLPFGDTSMGKLHVGMVLSY